MIQWLSQPWFKRYKESSHIMHTGFSDLDQFYIVGKCGALAISWEVFQDRIGKKYETFLAKPCNSFRHHKFIPECVDCLSNISEDIALVLPKGV